MWWNRIHTFYRWRMQQWLNDFSWRNISSPLPTSNPLSLKLAHNQRFEDASLPRLRKRKQKLINSRKGIKFDLFIYSKKSIYSRNVNHDIFKSVIYFFHGYSRETNGNELMKIWKIKSYRQRETQLGKRSRNW